MNEIDEKAFVREIEMLIGVTSPAVPPIVKRIEAAALRWSASQVCRWYDETRCRERACPCVPIQDRAEKLLDEARRDR